MKRLAFHLTVLMTFMLPSACSSLEEDQHADQIVVTASIGAETRTSIGSETGNGHKVVWSEGDRILISTGISNKNKATYVAASYGSSTASFIQEDASKTLDFTGGAIAGYPAETMSIGNPDENNELYFSIPSEQNYRKDSFDEGAMPMISDLAYEPMLNFRNAAGVLRLNISAPQSDVSVSDITITTAEYISGECGYIPKTQKIFFDDSMQCTQQVSLLCGNGVNVSSDGVPFYIVVPHQTYSEMAICVSTTEGKQQTFRMKEGKEITVERSTITTIPLSLTEIEDTKDPKVNIKIESVTYDNIKFSFEVKNTTSYYCGFQTKLSFMRDMESNYIIESLPYATQYTSPLSYTGNISTFQPEMKDILIESGQSYVIWFIPYKKDGNYTADDIVYAETMTKSFVPGGNVQVTYKDVVIDKTSISMTLRAPSSTYIYCILLTEEEFAQYPTEAQRIDLLLEPGGRSRCFDTYEDIFVVKSLRPGARMILMAVATDKYGQYGPLLVEMFETEPIPYNGIKVSIDKDIEAARNTETLTWSTTGGEVVGYRYFLQSTSSYRWINTFLTDVSYVQETLYLDPGLYYLNSGTTPSASTKGFTKGTEYILVVCAADAEGNISKADSWTFTY